MTFLSNLFRRAKTENVSGQRNKAPVRRSMSAPCEGSDTSDNDTLDIFPSRLHRRGAIDIQARPKTTDGILVRPTNPVPNVRNSRSISSDASSDTPFRSQFKDIKQIHRGKCATVFQAVDRNSKKRVVLKAYAKHNMTSFKYERLEQERQALESAELRTCPSIASLQSTFEDDAYYYLVLSFCAGPTLIEHMVNLGGRIPEATAAVQVVCPLLQGLEALHIRGIIHRHLKPEHIMCGPSGVTLIDFADSICKATAAATQRVGGLEYMAPEMLDKPCKETILHQVLYHGIAEEELPSYDEKVDIWSLGVVVYEVLTGCQPFYADDAQDMVLCHQRAFQTLDCQGVPEFISNRGLSEAAQDFLLQALQLDPAERPSAAELLQHPWVQQICARKAAGNALRMRSVSSPGACVSTPLQQRTLMSPALVCT